MHMKIRILFLSILIPAIIHAQFQVKVKMQNASDSIAYLKGMLFDDKNYIPKDTLELYKSNIISRNNKSIIGGIYYMQFPTSKQKIFFAIENRDTLQLNITGSDYLQSIKSNSKKNNLFFDYQRLEKSYSYVDSAYAGELAKGKKFNLAQKDAFFKVKRDTLIGFRKKVMKSLKSSDVLYLHFNTLNELDEFLPERKNIASRNAFIKNFNLNNPQLLFTPNIEDILFEYLSAYPMHADSLCKGMDTILTELDCKTKSYPYVFEYFAKLLRNRNVQNNTEGYNYLINKYIKNAKCAYPNEAKANEFLNQLKQTASQSLKDTCLNLLLKDTLDATQNLHEFAKKFDFTVVEFYAPTCEHCQVEMPEMDSIISLLETRYNVRIGKYAVCNEPGIPKEQWTAFIYKYNLLNNYTHVILPQENNDARQAFDAYSNPTFHLINNEAKLESKKISPATLKRFFATRKPL